MGKGHGIHARRSGHFQRPLAPPGLAQAPCQASGRPFACPVFHLSLVLGLLSVLGMTCDLLEGIHAVEVDFGGELGLAIQI